jgi:hypothetical protein
MKKKNRRQLDQSQLEAAARDLRDREAEIVALADAEAERQAARGRAGETLEEARRRSIEAEAGPKPDEARRARVGFELAEAERVALAAEGAEWDALRAVDTVERAAGYEGLTRQERVAARGAPPVVRPPAMTAEDMRDHSLRRASIQGLAWAAPEAEGAPPASAGPQPNVTTRAPKPATAVYRDAVDVLPDSSFFLDEMLLAVAPGVHARIPPKNYAGYRLCMGRQIDRDAVVIRAYRHLDRATGDVLRARGDLRVARERVAGMARRISTDSALMPAEEIIRLIADHDRTDVDVRAYADRLAALEAHRVNCAGAARQARAAADEAWDAGERAFGIWLEAIAEALAKMRIGALGSKYAVDWTLWTSIHAHYYRMRRRNRDVAMATVLANQALGQLQLARRYVDKGKTLYVRVWAACWTAQEDAKHEYIILRDLPNPREYGETGVPAPCKALWNVACTADDIRRFGVAEAKGVHGTARISDYVSPSDWAGEDDDGDEEEEEDEASDD